MGNDPISAEDAAFIMTKLRTGVLVVLALLWWPHAAHAQTSERDSGDAAGARTEPWVIRPSCIPAGPSAAGGELAASSRPHPGLAAAAVVIRRAGARYREQPRYRRPAVCPPIAEADILRASSGQAARGVPGALLPSGLSAGALGVGVNQAGGTGGVGSAGGISGGGGRCVPQVGNIRSGSEFQHQLRPDPSPLNSLVVAGVPQVTTSSSASSVNYTQLFPQGSSLTMTVNGIAQTSTQQSLLFNPAVVSRLALGVNQPLLSGFGFLPNKRFLMVAPTTLPPLKNCFARRSRPIVQVEDAYWAWRLRDWRSIAAEHAREAARQLVKETEAGWSRHGRRHRCHCGGGGRGGIGARPDRGADELTNCSRRS